MLKHGEINPLNVQGLRQLDFCPPHFTTLTLEVSTMSEKRIADWIWENLQGRFYIGPVDVVDDGHYHRRVCVAFELAEELSYFSLSLNQI